MPSLTHKVQEKVDGSRLNSTVGFPNNVMQRLGNPGHRAGESTSHAVAPEVWSKCHGERQCSTIFSKLTRFVLSEKHV